MPDEPYVISAERLAEIKAMLSRYQSGWQIHPAPGVTIYDLAGAVDDFLIEREDRERASGPEVERG